jgi:hypothetical protein
MRASTLSFPELSMKKAVVIGLVFALGLLLATTGVPHAPSFNPCTPDWFSYVSRHYVDVTDGEGHGPDPGSNEWLASVERQLGLQAGGNASDSQRCQLIQSRLEQRTFIVNQQLGWMTSF